MFLNLRVPSLARYGYFFIALSLAGTAISCGGGGGEASRAGTSQISTSSGPSVFPLSLTIYPDRPFSILVTPNQTSGSGTSVTSAGPLPAGISSSTTFPVSIPSEGALLNFNADKSLVPGKYTLTLTLQSGSTTTMVPVSVTASVTPPPTFFFARPLFGEIGIPSGGSAQIQFTSLPNSTTPVDYEVALSLSPLPPGTTAKISPPIIIPGQTVTVTLSASGNAPVSQNFVVALIGTPSAPVQTVGARFLVDVTAPPGALPNSRTDYMSTAGSPYWATFDRTHNVIYASNPSWNRVDVISNTSHRIIKNIPIRSSPRGIDIALDGSRVWVATESQEMYAIDPVTFAATRYALPRFLGLGRLTSWEGDQVFCLADGTLGLYFTEATGGGPRYFAIWDPNANTLTGISPPTGGEFPASWEIVLRSGDGKRVYSIGADSGGESFYFDVLKKTVSPPSHLTGYAILAAVNMDSSRIAVYYTNCFESCFNMYDGEFNLIGPLPGGGFGGPLWSGGMIFSPDNRTLYEVSAPLDIPVIFNIDPNTLAVRGVAPALGMIPVGHELDPPFFLGVPFAVDDTGMILGALDYGISFDDATFFQNFSILQPGAPIFLQHMSPYFGPLGGGTTSSGFGNAFSLTPDVWYGSNRGTATLKTNGLFITSPPANAPGPVNVKILFPDGVQVFDPLFFSYGPLLQYSLFTGAPSEGNVAGQVAGFGLPYDAADGTLTIAGNAANITTHKSQYPPFTPEPFPSTFLNFTIPPGSPGWADVTIHTSDGTSTLPRAIYYAQSATDYSSADTLRALLYDDKRQQLYLSAGDHIDVFSLASNQFMSPISGPAQGSTKRFTGLALTPDGSRLLAADQLDASLAVISLDNPGSNYFIPLAAPDTSDTRCLRGPLYVTADRNNQAYVAYGGVPDIGCGPGGGLYAVDLGTRTWQSMRANDCLIYPGGPSNGAHLASSKDGSVVAFGGDIDGFGRFCVYDVINQSYATASFYQPYGAEVSADGNVVASQFVFTDSAARIVGRAAHPEILYGANASDTGFDAAEAQLLLKPKLNDSGSLYYWASAHGFEIVDVLHGTSLMRFSLAESVKNTVAPIAIDSGGRHVYVITDQGLTIVDLGSAPLAIGHLSATTVSAGTQVTLRGSGFKSGTQGFVGTRPATVSMVDENTLLLSVPLGISGTQDLILKNEDGTTYTLENALTIR